MGRSSGWSWIMTRYHLVLLTLNQDPNPYLPVTFFSQFVNATLQVRRCTFLWCSGNKIPTTHVDFNGISSGRLCSRDSCFSTCRKLQIRYWGQFHCCAIKLYFWKYHQRYAIITIRTINFFFYNTPHAGNWNRTNNYSPFNYDELQPNPVFNTRTCSLLFTTTSCWLFSSYDSTY